MFLHFWAKLGEHGGGGSFSFILGPFSQSPVQTHAQPSMHRNSHAPQDRLLRFYRLHDNDSAGSVVFVFFSFLSLPPDPKTPS